MSYRDVRYPVCADGSPCPPSQTRTYFPVVEGTLFGVTHDSRSTRVELGGGIAASDVAAAVAGNVFVSRRLTPSAPFWATIGWQPRKWLTTSQEDGQYRPLLPHAFSAGLKIRRDK